MHMLRALAAFVGMFAVDYVCAKYTVAITERRTLVAAVLAAAMFVATATTVLTYTHDALMIVPAAAGAFAGTYVANRSDKKQRGNTMVTTQTGAPAPQEDVSQEIGVIGRRLREKSTYAGLAVVVSFALPYLTAYIPGLHGASVDSVVNLISYAGMFLGGALAIVFPEKTVASQ